MIDGPLHPQLRGLRGRFKRGSLQCHGIRGHVASQWDRSHSGSSTGHCVGVVQSCTTLYSTSVSSSLSISEARALLPQVLERVIGGEEVTITRHGKPVAVVVRPDALRVRRAEAALDAADGVRLLLEEASELPLESAPALTARRAEELVEGVRADRTGR